MTSPDLSNNPFIENQSNPHNRFPDLNAGQSSGFQPAAGIGYGYGYNSGSFSSSNSAQFQPQQQQQYYPSQTPSQFNGFGYSPSPVASQPTGYQPTAYGQSPYQNSYQAQASYQQQPQSFASYSTPQLQNYQNYSSQQYQPQSSAYLSEFDPYSANNTVAQSQSPYSISSGSSATYSQNQSASSGQGTYGDSRAHPRDYIRTHKAELELWVKCMASRFETLANAVKEYSRTHYHPKILPTLSCPLWYFSELMVSRSWDCHVSLF